MAGEAVRGGSSILTIDMTVGACGSLMGAGQREIGVVVIEGGRAPGGGRVAHGAVVRKLIGQMIRFCRLVVIVLMAREAI